MVGDPRKTFERAREICRVRELMARQAEAALATYVHALDRLERKRAEAIRQVQASEGQRAGPWLRELDRLAREFDAMVMRQHDLERAVSAARRHLELSRRWHDGLALEARRLEQRRELEFAADAALRSMQVCGKP